MRVRIQPFRFGKSLDMGVVLFEGGASELDETGLLEEIIDAER